MPSLPTPGGDLDTWGTELNTYLSVEHNADGTHAFSATGVYYESVIAHGAVGNGVTNDTAAFQATADAAIANKVPMFVDPGYSYLINGQVVIDAHFFHWIMPYAGFQIPSGDPTDMTVSKIICGNTTAPCILFGGSSAARAGLKVDGMKIWANANRWRVPMVQFGDPGSMSKFRISDVWIDGRSFDTDGFLMHTPYNGQVNNCHFQNMTQGIAITLRNASAVNTGNIGFHDIDSNQAPIMFLLKEWYSGSGNLVNNIHFDNCKTVGRNPDYFAAGKVNGTTSAGSTTVVLQAGQGVNFTAGRWITFIRADTTVWCDQVASVATDTITLKKSTGLPFALAAGDDVIAGEFHTISGGSVEALKFTVPHYENSNGFLGAGVNNVRIEQPGFGNLFIRGVVLARACQQVHMIDPDGIGALTTGAVVFHQMNDSNNARNSLVGACKSDLGIGGDATSHMLQVDGGATVTYNQRAGGYPAMLGCWHQDTTVAASQTNVQLTGPHASAARGIRVPHYGMLVGIQASVSTGRSAGTLTATVYKNGSATALTCVLDGTNTTRNLTEYENTNVPIVPHDVLDVRVTTDSGWLPTANNLDVTLWVEQ